MARDALLRALLHLHERGIALISAQPMVSATSGRRSEPEHERVAGCDAGHRLLKLLGSNRGARPGGSERAPRAGVSSTAAIVADRYRRTGARSR